MPKPVERSERRLYMVVAVKDGSDTITDQIDKYILFPSLFLPFIDILG